MSLRSIELAATDSNWRLFMVRKADPAFLAFQKKVHERYNYTCCYCGFRSKQNLEIINLDGNYRNNHLDNLGSACSLCAQCFFLDAIGKGGFGGGVLIYLPELPQNWLNALCHVLFTSIITGSHCAKKAKSIYRSFRLRSQLLEKQLGEGLSNPALLGQLLIDTQIENSDSFKEILTTKIRLLPDLSHFSSLVETWVQYSLKELLFEKLS